MTSGNLFFVCSRAPRLTGLTPVRVWPDVMPVWGRDPRRGRDMYVQTQWFGVTNAVPAARRCADPECFM